MAKKKNTKKVKVAPLPTLPPVPTPFSPPDLSKGIEQRTVKKSKEGWSEFTLDDGAKLLLRAVLIDVKRAVDQFTLEGDPLYLLQMTIVSNTKAPPRLRKRKK